MTCTRMYLNSEFMDQSNQSCKNGQEKARRARTDDVDDDEGKGNGPRVAAKVSVEQ